MENVKSELVQGSPSVSALDPQPWCSSNLEREEGPRGHPGNGSSNTNPLICPKIVPRLVICFAQAFPRTVLFFNSFRKKRLRWKAHGWAVIILIMEPQDWEEVESAFWPFHFSSGSRAEQRQRSW